MAAVEPARSEDLDAFVELQTALFREDAGVHDRYTDLSWPQRESAADFEQLRANPDALVLLAREEGRAVGFLVGYLSSASPTRRPVTFAILRSLYVCPDARGTGAADALVESLVVWGRGRDCAAAYVDAYVANERAQRFYARHGFAAHSLQRVREL